MGASSSSCFYTAKAEESPSAVADTVEAMKMVLSNGVSTPGRSEYYSTRCEAMLRSRGQFADAVALEIEFSKSHWSEVVRVEVGPQSAEEEELNCENRKLLKQLRKEHPSLFGHNLAGYEMGRMIAKGGQAEIYEVVGDPYFVMKVFERGTSLRDLKRSWPLFECIGDPMHSKSGSVARWQVCVFDVAILGRPAEVDRPSDAGEECGWCPRSAISLQL